MSTAFAVFVVQPTGYIHSQVFAEVAACLHSGLLSLGYDSIRTDTPEVEGRRLIVVGPNLLPFARIHVLPKGTILYNLEQYAHWSNPFLRDPDYVLWDFSAENSRRLGLKPTAILPVGYCSCLTHITPAQPQDIDVLFLGSPSPRRSEILERCRTRGLRVEEVFGVYGPERDQLIARSKVHLNIHYAPGALMEQPRLTYLAANRCIILSELSSLEAENEEWAGGVMLSDYEQLPLNAEYLCDLLKETRKRMGAEALDTVQKRSIGNYLSDALARTL